MKLIKYTLRKILNFFSIDLKIQKYYKPILINKNQAGDGTSMKFYFDLIKNQYHIDVKIFFEIGANYCQDSTFAQKYFSLDSKNIFCFEPNPIIFNSIKDNEFNTYKLAISDKLGTSNFNITNTKEKNNSGISSLKKNKTKGVELVQKVSVDMTTLKSFLQTEGILNIDFLKVDAEGNDFEVIHGLGEKINDVKIIQIESSRKEIFEGETIFSDLNNYIIKKGFSLVFYKLSIDNVSGDALYINDNFIVNKKQYT